MHEARQTLAHSLLSVGEAISGCHWYPHDLHYCGLPERLHPALKKKKEEIGVGEEAEVGLNRKETHKSNSLKNRDRVNIRGGSASSSIMAQCAPGSKSPPSFSHRELPLV